MAATPKGQRSAAEIRARGSLMLALMLTRVRKGSAAVAVTNASNQNAGHFNTRKWTVTVATSADRRPTTTCTGVKRQQPGWCTGKSNRRNTRS